MPRKSGRLILLRRIRELTAEVKDLRVAFKKATGKNPRRVDYHSQCLKEDGYERCDNAL